MSGSGGIRRPSVVKEEARREAAKIAGDAEEHRYLIRMTERTEWALKQAAAQRRMSVKYMLLKLAQESGVDVDPADLRRGGK